MRRRPELGPGGGVQGDDPLPAGEHALGVDAAVGHRDRRVAGAEAVGPEDERRAAVGPALPETRLEGDAVPVRPPPLRPVLAGGCGQGQEQQGGERGEPHSELLLAAQPLAGHRQRGFAKRFEMVLEAPARIARLQIARRDARGSGNLGHEGVNEFPAGRFPRNRVVPREHAGDGVRVERAALVEVAAVPGVLEEEDVPHRLVRLGRDPGDVAPGDGGEDRGERAGRRGVVPGHVTRSQHVTARVDAGVVGVAGLDLVREFRRSAEKGGDQVRRRVVDRVRDAGPPDHVAPHGPRGGRFKVFLDLRLGVRVEVDDGGVIRIADDVHRSRDGLVERVGAVREELDQVGGLDRAGRGAGDVGRFVVEGFAVRRADPDAPAEVGEVRRRPRRRGRRRSPGVRRAGRGSEGLRCTPSRTPGRAPVRPRGERMRLGSFGAGPTWTR